MLSERLKTAIPLIVLITAIFVAPIRYSSWLFAVLSVIMLYLAIDEAFSLLQPKFRAIQQLIFTALGEGVLLMEWAKFLVPSKLTNRLTDMTPGLVMLAMLCAFAFTFAHKPDKETVNGILASIGIAAFIIWPLIMLVRIFRFFPPCELPIKMQSDDPRLLLAYILIVTKIADCGAYFVGSATARRSGGNHRLSPLVSPKKSWEGLIGGTIFSLAASLIFFAIKGGKLVYYDRVVLNWMDGIILGIAASVIGLIGDLAESALKRAADQKDSGHLPGIGGILDMLDSLLPMGPLFYAYISIRYFLFFPNPPLP